METLLVLNDPPYGNERPYNALRLAGALAKRESGEVRVFLMGDAAACAKAGQKVPTGYYNLNTMIKALALKQAPVAVCGSCMDARGIEAKEIVEGSHRGTIEELAEWTAWADKVIVF